ncbi:MAG TPA: hypothetical protein PLM71_04850 [Syntrophorhabdaceae bacterium]|nr:hypothetical protein [Syntrophorhabdaceae bacterium]HPU29631.1 hypothetical protein [Syntrophorhabdaceae bacterium]
MAKETFIFELKEAFNIIADEIKREYNAHIWLIEVLGKRYSYIAGCKDDSFLPPEFIYISEKFAVASSDWGKLPIEKKEELFSFLNKYVNKT